MNADMWNTMAHYIEAGQIKAAIAFLEAGLTRCQSPRFKALIGATFTNDPADLASTLNGFITFCDQTFDVRAVYLEMNGFDINPDRWYCDFFGYQHYNDDPDDLDWLAEWNSDVWPEFTLTGLEAVQADFDWYSNHNGYKDLLASRAAEYAVPLVMCKFAYFVQQAIATRIVQKNVPVLATAHDFDFAARFVA